MATRAKSHRNGTGGPPLGVLALVSLVLFLVGLFVAAATAGKFPPAPTASASTIAHYFRDHDDAVRIGAFFTFASSVPLAIYAATASARLRNLGVRAPGATIALVGGSLASVMLALSGLISWVLSRTEVRGNLAIVRALLDLGFAAGGPGHVAFLGLLIAGVAVPSLFARLLPRPLVIVGLVLAVIAELSTLSLAADGFDFLLPIARFLAMIWLIAAGFLLPITREPAAREQTQP